MMKKILMIAGDYVEDYEMMVPFQALQMAGFEVVAVAPGKKSGEVIRTAIHDFEGDMTYSEKRGHNFALNGDFTLVEEKEFDALVLPGGRSPEYLRLDVRVIELAGAEFVDLPMTGAVTDGNFVTAPAWPAHPEWLRQLLALLR